MERAEFYRRAYALVGQYRRRVLEHHELVKANLGGDFTVPVTSPRYNETISETFRSAADYIIQMSQILVQRHGDSVEAFLDAPNERTLTQATNIHFLMSSITEEAARLLSLRAEVLCP